MLSRLPLAGTTVVLRAPAPFVPQVMAMTESGSGGMYFFCVPGPWEGWDVLARLDTLESRPMPVDEAGSADTLYLVWSEPANLSGTVRLLGSGTPVVGARVTIDGRRVRAVTDDQGAFRLRGLGAGALVITTTALGLESRTDSVFVASGSRIALDIVMSEGAIELPPITVTARSELPLEFRTRRSLGMTEAEIAEALPRTVDFVSLLRYSNRTGLQVSPVTSAGICVQFLRSARGGCAMVEVFVNGQRMSMGADFLLSLNLMAVKEFRIYRPADAQFLFMGPNTSNGAINIILR